MGATDITAEGWTMPELGHCTAYRHPHHGAYTYLYAVACGMRDIATTTDRRVRYGRIARYVYRRALRHGIILD